MTDKGPSWTHGSGSSHAAGSSHLRLSLAYAVILLAGLGLAAMIDWRYRGDERSDLAVELDEYREESEADQRAVVADVEELFLEVYQNLRTVARLPGIRQLDPGSGQAISFHGGEGIEASTRITVQEIYNNLASAVAVSELYIVPVNLDPDADGSDPDVPRQPLATFDQLVLDRNSRQGRELYDFGSEIDEYRLMKQQLAWLKERYPREDGFDGLDYPAISGPEVVTCDVASHMPSSLNGRERLGLVFSVPYYGEDGALRGCVSGVILTHALSHLLPSGDFAIVNPTYGYEIPPHEPGQWLASKDYAARAEPDPGLLYSQALPLGGRDLGGRWSVWAGHPDSMFWERPDIRATISVRNINYGLTLALTLAAMFCARVVLRKQEAVRLANISLEQQVKERSGDLERAVREIDWRQYTLDQHSIISVTDGHGQITYANEKFCQMSGYRLEELIGKDHRVVNSGHHPDSYFKGLYTTLGRGEIWRGEMRNRSKDGSIYWVDTTIVPKLGADGVAEQYIALRIDITERKLLEKAQREIGTALDAANDCVFIFEPDTLQFTYTNTGATKQVGYSNEELRGMTPLDIKPDFDEASFREKVRPLIEGTQPSLSFQTVHRHRDGHDVPVEISLQFVPSIGKRGRFIAIVRDISGRLAAERELRQSERRYKLAISSSRDGLWDWDLVTDRVYYAPKWKQILGLGDQEVGDSPEEWLGRIDPADRDRFRDELAHHLEGSADHFEAEFRMVHKDRGVLWVLCRGAIARDADGRAVQVAGSLEDITEIKRTQEALRKAAEHDHLTELPNRELFRARLQQTIDHAQANPGYRFAVLFFDFDRFKVINDSLGHNVGDALLVDVAEQFRLELRETDLAARFGGDEFVVLLNDLSDYRQARDVADRLLKKFASPHRLSGHDVTSTASIGLVTNAQHYTRAEDILRDADAAMYQAKEAGKARVVEFDQAMFQAALDRLKLEADLREAIQDKSFRLVYQPIVSLTTGELDGFEALLRWDHPDRGAISPADFIPIAEDTGLIVPIGQWVIHEACRQLHQWNSTLTVVAPISMNINLSMRQLCHPDAVEMIRREIVDLGIDPKYLKLEVTESTIIDDRLDMITLLRQIKALGIGLAMDDFGTGHSSLSNLHRLPIDVLKIDQSFIKSMSANHALAAVMQTIITLAEHLGMATVAEGVETRDQLALLQALDCVYGQGYLFGKPMTAQDAEAYIRRAKRFSASA
jgi:diguanylate cyclase (GGDEF)-like protein/PAS domain S-box-containing protein